MALFSQGRATAGELRWVLHGPYRVRTRPIYVASDGNKFI